MYWLRKRVGGGVARGTGFRSFSSLASGTSTDRIVTVFEEPIVMLVLETTRLSPAAGDRITEVAALRKGAGLSRSMGTPVGPPIEYLGFFVTTIVGASARRNAMLPSRRNIENVVLHERRRDSIEFLIGAPPTIWAAGEAAGQPAIVGSQ